MARRSQFDALSFFFLGLCCLGFVRGVEAATALVGECPCQAECADVRYPPKYSTFEESGVRRCFRPFDTAMSWEEAGVACRRDGGKLAESEAFLTNNLFVSSLWVGATTEGDSPTLLWNSTKLPLSTALVSPHGDAEHSCGFLYEGGHTVYRFQCSRAMKFLCERPLISFAPQRLELTAAEGAGPLLGSRSLTINVGVNGAAPQDIFFVLSEACGFADLSDMSKADSAGVWSAPSLTPGTLTLCWHGPDTEVPGVVRVATHTTGIVVVVNPAPEVLASSILVPAAILPHTIVFEGSHIDKDAVFALYPLTTAVLCSGEAVVSWTSKTALLPESLPVGVWSVCVAAWGTAVTTLTPSYRSTESNVTIQTRPTFFSDVLYLPLAVALAGRGVVVRGTGLDQKHIWLALSSQQMCTAPTDAALLRADMVYNLSSTADQGRSLRLCYAVSALDSVAPTTAYTDSGISLTITSKPDITVNPIVTHTKSYAEGISGVTVEVFGRNFKTRGTSSMLFIATSDTAGCTSPVVGSELIGDTVNGTGVTAPVSGKVYVCVVCAVSADAPALEVYPTSVVLDISLPPSFTQQTLWVSAMPMPLPQGQNIANLEGIFFALAEDVLCANIVAHAQGALPVLALPASEMLTYTMCWGQASTGVPSLWQPTEVVYNILPQPVVDTADRGSVRLPQSAYSGVTVEVHGEYLRNLTALFVQGDCTGSVVHQEDLSCDPWCSVVQVAVPGGLEGGTDYVLCAVVGGVTHSAGLSVAVTSTPSAPVQQHVVSLSDLTVGTSVTLLATDVHFAFYRVVDEDVACSTATGEVVSLRDGVVHIAANDPRFVPGVHELCVSSGVASPVTPWVAFNVTIESLAAPTFATQHHTPAAAELWHTVPYAVTLSGTALAQPLLYSACSEQCQECSFQVRADSGNVSLSHAWVKSQSAGATFHLCWAVQVGDALQATGVQITVPNMVPLSPVAANLTYGEAVPGPASITVDKAPGLWGALVASDGSVITTWDDLSDGEYLADVSGLTSGEQFAMVVTYNGMTGLTLPSEVSVRRAGVPIFMASVIQLSLTQLLLGSAVTVSGSFIQRGIVGRVGCTAPRPDIAVFPFTSTSDTTAAASIPAMPTVTGLSEATSFPICWAPIVDGSADWAAGGETGVVVQIGAVPTFEASSALMIDRVAVLAGAGYSFTLAVDGVTTPLWAVLSGDITCSTPLASTPFQHAGASVSASLSASVVAALPQVSYLCWSAFEDGRLPQRTALAISKQGDPVFTPWTGVLLPQDLIGGAVLEMALSGGDEGVVVRLVMDTDACDAPITDNVVPTALALNDSTPLGKGMVYACWMVKAADGQILKPAERIPEWSVLVLNYPLVLMVAGEPLPWTQKIFKNSRPFAIGGNNMTSAVFSLVEGADCAGATSMFFPLDVSGLEGSFTLCMALSAGGSTGEFYSVPGLSGEGIVLTPIDPTIPPETPAPTTETPDGVVVPTDPPKTVPPPTSTPDPTPIPLSKEPERTVAPNTSAPETTYPETQPPAPPPTLPPRQCAGVDALGIVSSMTCFGSGSLNEAGRLVGCLSAGSLGPNCMAQYDRCVQDVVGPCPDGRDYTTESPARTLLLDLDYDDFHTDLFVAAVAAEVRALPWLVNVVSISRGSVAVTITMKGPDGDKQLATLNESVQDGSLFALYNWTVLAYNGTETGAPGTYTPPETSDDGVDPLWPILCLIAVGVGLVLAGGVTAGHRYIRLADEVCIADLVVPTPPRGYEDSGSSDGDSEGRIVSIANASADVTAEGLGGITSCPSSVLHTSAEPPLVLSSGAHGECSTVALASPARIGHETVGPVTPLPFDKPLPTVPTPASTHSVDITPSRSPLPPLPHPP